MSSAYRVPSVICGILTSALVFLFAARWRGLWFAVALAIVQNGSQPFVYLSQQNRFYSLPLLLLTLALALMWSPRRGAIPIAGIALLTVMAVLSQQRHRRRLHPRVLRRLPAVSDRPGARARGDAQRRRGGHQPGALTFSTCCRSLSGWHSTGNSHARARVVHGACRHSSARAGIAGGLGGPGSRRSRAHDDLVGADGSRARSACCSSRT